MLSRGKAAAACGVGVAVIASLARGGPLDPPVGPVASSHKTLTEVEPRVAVNATNTPGDSDSLYKISQPGSYYLTGNITGVAGKHGIEISVSNVSIDLRGFALVSPGGIVTLDGITGPAFGLLNVSVVDGYLDGWDGDGIDLSTNTANVRLERVCVRSVAGDGLKINLNSVVADCAAFSCGGIGITTGMGCTIARCTVRTCNAGISGGLGCVVVDCATAENSDDGVQLSFGGTISKCSAYGNGGSGIVAFGSGSTVSQCSAYDNGGNGIDVGGGGSTVIDCTARLNTLHGIHCTAACVVRGNTCSSNGSAGIHALGADNRIEGNHCIGNLRGIDVDVSGSLIRGNTCSGNSINWEISAGNAVGPIVISPTNPGNILGSGPFASYIGTSDPHANFSF